MTNIIKYVEEYGDRSFKDFSLNSVDMLIFSEISYWAFENSPLNDGLFSCAIKELNIYYLRESLTKDRWFPGKDKILYDFLSEKTRYSNIKIKYFEYILDQEAITQFSALTLELSDEISVIVYRGTDTSYTGWIEDFTMSFNEIMPSHKLAVSYLEKIINKDLARKYIVTGHSKGGNLASYAAVKSKNIYKNSIANIYDFDGPGFYKDFYELDEFKQIEGKIEKIIPESSIVGMMLENHDNVKVVQSNAILFLQHDPFQFKVENGNFNQLEDLKTTSKYLKSTTDSWINKFDNDQRKKILEAIFEIIKSSDAKDFKDLKDNWIKYIGNISKTDQDLWDIVKMAVDEYIDSAKNEISTSFKNK